MRMLGQAYSTSLNAVMIQFIGGPYDGESGLYDSAFADSISFCESDKRVTHEYVPIHKGLPQYRFERTYKWSKP